MEVTRTTFDRCTRDAAHKNQSSSPEASARAPRKSIVVGRISLMALSRPGCRISVHNRRVRSPGCRLLRSLGTGSRQVPATPFPEPFVLSQAVVPLAGPLLHRLGHLRILMSRASPIVLVRARTLARGCAFFLKCIAQKRCHICSRALASQPSKRSCSSEATFSSSGANNKGEKRGGLERWCARCTTTWGLAKRSPRVYER